MICLFSRTDDLTTTEVMRWLMYFGVKDVIRINSDDPRGGGQFPILRVDENALSFQIHGRTYDLADIRAVWYRKGKNWLCNTFLQVPFSNQPTLHRYIQKKLAGEEMRLSEYFHFLIEETRPTLGSSRRGDLNKLIILNYARKAGLMIPSFLVSNSKSLLNQKIQKTPCITKPIADVMYLFDTKSTDTGYFSYTEKIDVSALDMLSQEFSPSLIQQEIVKEFEARVFYLEGTCYAMGIFSQSDQQTSVDFRRYNMSRPNRMVPLQISVNLQESIKKLFDELELNTGSVDFLVDREGRYFFLEINPVGQFGWVSSRCNYFLEQQVAKTLIAYTGGTYAE